MVPALFLLVRTYPLTIQNKIVRGRVAHTLLAVVSVNRSAKVNFSVILLRFRQQRGQLRVVFGGVAQLVQPLGNGGNKLREQHPAALLLQSGHRTPVEFPRNYVICEHQRVFNVETALAVAGTLAQGTLDLLQ